MAFQVTATQGGSTANGMLLHVFVLTGAKTSANQTGNTNSTQFATTTAFTASITNSANSSIYLASKFDSSSNTPTGSSMTLVDTSADATNSLTEVTGHATGLSAGTTTRGFTFAIVSQSGPFTMLEILASGTIAEDGSAPAVVSTTGAGPVTTASFTPPPGSLVVALVASNGGSGVTTFTVSGGGLGWSEKVKNNPSAGSYAGIWIADAPNLAGTVQPRATIPVPRRGAARALAGYKLPPATFPALVKNLSPGGQLIIRRFPSTAVYGGSIGSVNPAPITGVTPGWVIVRRQPVHAFYGGIGTFPAAAPPAPAGPPPAIPTSGGTTRFWIREFREIRPGDVPASGAQMTRPTGRAFLVPVPDDVEHTTHAWDQDTVDPGPGLLDKLADATERTTAAAGRAVELGRIFADPPYQRQHKTCGAIRTVGGTMLACKRKPGHAGKHSDRGLDWG